jgi:hypothetical protein
MRRRGSGLWRMTAGALGAVVVGLAAGPGAAQSYADDSFCSGSARMLIDYQAPLKSVSRLAPPPPAGRLAFGPAALRIPRPRSVLVLAGRERLDLHGALASANPPDLRLNWKVETTLTMVNSKGKAIQAARTRTQLVGTVQSFKFRQFGFGAQVEPGNYRQKVAFSTEAGDRLGAYEVIYRVLPIRNEFRLVLENPTLAAGSSATVRIENRGTVSSTFGYRESLWAGVGTTGQLIAPEPGSYTNDLPLVDAGMSSRCFSFSVPRSLSPGTYTVGFPVMPKGGSQELVTSTFQVTG